MAKRDSSGNRIQIYFSVQSKKDSDPMKIYFPVQLKKDSDPIKLSYPVGKFSFDEKVPIYFAIDALTGKRESKRLKAFFGIVDQRYFPSMLPDIDNQPGQEPSFDEKAACMYYRIFVQCPDLGEEYELTGLHILGPVEIYEEASAGIKFSFRLLNHESQYTKNSGDFADLFVKDYISYVRETVKFIKIQVLSVCGEQQKLETFSQLVIKRVTGDIILSISGVDLYSEVLCRSKDWPSYVTEETLVRMEPDSLPSWEANKVYSEGDIIQAPAGWSWEQTTSKTINIDKVISGNNPKLWLFPIGFNPAAGQTQQLRIKIWMEFESSGMKMVVYPETYASQNWGNTYPYDELFSGTREPATYNNNIIMFYSIWAYPRASTGAFRCKVAGTSGSSSPNWKPFKSAIKNSDGSYDPMAWINENMEGEVITAGNLSSGGDLPNYGIHPHLFNFGSTITDGTVTWEPISFQSSPRYMAIDTTRKGYNRYLGSQLYVNWLEMWPPDFTNNETAGIFEFVEFFDKDIPVNFVSPLPAKWLIKNIFDKAFEEAFSYSEIEAPPYRLQMNFQDFLIYNNIQVQGRTARDLLLQILGAYGLQYYTQEKSESELIFVISPIPLSSEVKDERVDFSIDESLLRGIDGADQDFKRINTINMIKPGKVRQARVQLT